MNIQKNEKGFTLIELFICIAIMGILTAIAVPQFKAYRKAHQSGQSTPLHQGVHTEQKIIDSFKCPKCQQEFSITIKN